MNALAAYGVEELDALHGEMISGGNAGFAGMLVAAGVAGFRWGYTFLGPWLQNEI